jgi:hypothetical protein
MSYQPKVYNAQGGDELVIASGGTVKAESGGKITVEAGGELEVLGTSKLGAAELSYAAINAAGSTQANATAITSAVALVDAADGTKGVRLPASAAGKVVFVINKVAATHALKVYPATGGKIDGGSANASVNVAAAKRAVFLGDGADWWMLTGA